LIVFIDKKTNQIAKTIVILVLKGISLLIKETNKSKIKNDNKKYVVDKDSELSAKVWLINLER
jgi:uncharacterized ubiquitin-like protein YukD